MANSRKAREAARIPTATGRSRRTTPTMVSTTRLRDRARSRPGLAAGQHRLQLLAAAASGGSWPAMAEAQTADRASETGEPEHHQRARDHALDGEGLGAAASWPAWPAGPRPANASTSAPVRPLAGSSVT
jgi:hypothetical protein